MDRGWIFKSPAKMDCPRCNKQREYFLVGGNLTTNYDVVCCSDCYWQEAQSVIEKTKETGGSAALNPSSVPSL